MSERAHRAFRGVRIFNWYGARFNLEPLQEVAISPKKVKFVDVNGSSAPEVGRLPAETGHSRAVIRSLLNMISVPHSWQS